VPSTAQHGPPQNGRMVAPDAKSRQWRPSGKAVGEQAQRSCDHSGSGAVTKIARRRLAGLPLRSICSRMAEKNDDDRYSEEETAERAEKVIRRMLATPPQPRKAAPQKLAASNRPRRPPKKEPS
jgi:hypothetical protein